MIRGIHYFSAEVKTKIDVIPRGCFNIRSFTKTYFNPFKPEFTITRDIHPTLNHHSTEDSDYISITGYDDFNLAAESIKCCIVVTFAEYPSKHETLALSWVNIGQASMTMGQHNYMVFIHRNGTIRST